ncbi:hypothetical protein SPBR_03520 [Sporothrix brasiliensis 5110]|uniref:Uncharacterized protein n=1 Tax=Sporothrix brasiliensis 5110 TaxID=1398154 RepID=A0A0C2J197_9PEZI|nr:uncharacterized protein SPBR_03520 [Sporothrix brasiliensis 5110]KIH95111.1 hypothetical protein SPBR_03520 [Sporothrix brasiliensis 5110]
MDDTKSITEAGALFGNLVASQKGAYAVSSSSEHSLHLATSDDCDATSSASSVSAPSTLWSDNSKESLERMAAEDPDLPFYYGHRIDSDAQFQRILEHYLTREAFKQEVERINQIFNDFGADLPPDLTRNARKGLTRRRHQKLLAFERHCSAYKDRDWQVAARETPDNLRDARLAAYHSKVLPKNCWDEMETTPFPPGTCDLSGKVDRPFPRSLTMARYLDSMAREAVEAGLVTAYEVKLDLSQDKGQDKNEDEGDEEDKQADSGVSHSNAEECRCHRELDDAKNTANASEALKQYRGEAEEAAQFPFFVQNWIRSRPRVYPRVY